MSMSMETLTCAHGHKWKRQATKGRKPRFCPQHHEVPQDDSLTITLTCAAGHTWERPAGSKGKRPKFCPAHKPQVAKHTEPLVLKCAFDGHEWTREKRGGKPPAYCPEHKPEKVTAGTRVGKRGLPKVDLDNDLVNAVLNDPADTELKRKMTYVVTEFRNPREGREMGDWRTLHYTFNRLLEEAAKMLKQSDVKIEHIDIDLEM